MKTTTNKPPPTDMQRLRELARRPALFDEEVNELRELAAKFNLKIRMQRVDLVNWGQASEYTIG